MSTERVVLALALSQADANTSVSFALPALSLCVLMVEQA